MWRPSSGHSLSSSFVILQTSYCVQLNYVDTTTRATLASLECSLVPLVLFLLGENYNCIICTCISIYLLVYYYSPTFVFISPPQTFTVRIVV